MNAMMKPGATITSVLAPYTMDELLEWRMGARAAGRNTLADALSREIKRRVDESDTARPSSRAVNAPAVNGAPCCRGNPLKGPLT